MKNQFQSMFNNNTAHFQAHKHTKGETTHTFPWLYITCGYETFTDFDNARTHRTVSVNKKKVNVHVNKTKFLRFVTFKTIQISSLETSSFLLFWNKTTTKVSVWQLNV